MKVSAILRKFAKSREAAYLQHGRLTTERAKAISQIYKVADFFSSKSEQVQLRAVTQVESDLRMILPHGESRYTKLRDTILDLIDQANPITHAPTTTPAPDTADAGPAAAADRNPGIQLRLI